MCYGWNALHNFLENFDPICLNRVFSLMKSKKIYKIKKKFKKLFELMHDCRLQQH